MLFRIGQLLSDYIIQQEYTFRKEKKHNGDIHLTLLIVNDALNFFLE